MRFQRSLRHPRDVEQSGWSVGPFRPRSAPHLSHYRELCTSAKFRILNFWWHSRWSGGAAGRRRPQPPTRCGRAGGLSYALLDTDQEDDAHPRIPCIATGSYRHTGIFNDSLSPLYAYDASWRLTGFEIAPIQAYRSFATTECPDNLTHYRITSGRRCSLHRRPTRSTPSTWIARSSWPRWPFRSSNFANVVSTCIRACPRNWDSLLSPQRFVYRRWSNFFFFFSLIECPKNVTVGGHVS